MSVEPRGYEYPLQRVRVVPFPETFSTLFTEPAGLTEDVWPPTQIDYLGFYLNRLECRTIVIESHYVDRDFIDDTALFYSRSLRGYPNHCQRLHFFKKPFDETWWRDLVHAHNGRTEDQRVREFRDAYLGFSVIKPLPGALIGRTVLAHFGPTSLDDKARRFDGVRPYEVNLAGIDLIVNGLAFQQQDQGVSACATTALWSSVQKVAPMEGLQVATPASITQAASRYFLAGGRALPSEGLTIDQICEATRAAGLAPVVVRGGAIEQARAHIYGYLASGFPPVLAVQALRQASGHAVCAVGMKLGDIEPQTNPALHYRDGATAVRSVYIHDDRLGPYAIADLSPFTEKNGDICTALTIRWPGSDGDVETSLLRAIVIPVPTKLRLTIARMRALAVAIGDVLGVLVPSLENRVTIHCRYRLGAEYQRRAYDLRLSNEGLMRLVTGTAFSRYLGEINLDCPAGPLLDILLDATETQANPSVLACVRRHALPEASLPAVAALSRRLGADLFS